MPYARKTRKTTYRRKPVYAAKKKTYKKRAPVARKRKVYTKRKASSQPSTAFKAKVLHSTARVNSYQSDQAAKIDTGVNGILSVIASGVSLDQTTHQNIQARLNSDQTGDSSARKGYFLDKLTIKNEICNITQARLKCRSYLCRFRRDVDINPRDLYFNGFSANGNSVGDELSATPYQSPDFVQSVAILATKNQIIMPGASKYFYNSVRNWDMSRMNTVQAQCAYMKGATFWLHLIEGSLGMDATLVVPTTLKPTVILRQSFTAMYREMGDNAANIYVQNNLVKFNNTIRFINEEAATLDTDGNATA